MLWNGLGAMLHRLVRLGVLLCLIYLSWMGVAGAATPASVVPVPADVVIEPVKRSAGDISSEKLSQFVQAYLQVLNLIEQREGILQEAETQSEAQQLEREVEAEALAIIEASGLTWQEYLQLLGLANIDPEFGERIAAQLQESG